MDPAQELAGELRRHDPDRYVAALYAPADRRDDLIALHAFNAEIARIRDQVREPMLGEIRLQWWSDMLAAGAGPAGHPVADALARAIERHDLPVSALIGMIEARKFDLYNDPMPSVADLEGYCGETAGVLIQLASLILDPEAARVSADAAGHAGCAQAMTGLLALLPRHRARGQCYIPRNLLQAAGARAEDLFVEAPGEAALRAVQAMIALARDHLAAFERHAAGLPRSLRPAYLPLALARPWLTRLEAAGPAVFRHSVQLSPLRRHAAMLRRAVTGWSSRQLEQNH